MSYILYFCAIHFTIRNIIKAGFNYIFNILKDKGKLFYHIFFILTNSHEVCLNFQNENSKIRYKNIYNITIYLILSLKRMTSTLLGTDSYNMSLVVRKPAFCICENKDADQLRGNREADQRLCFRYTDSTIPLLPKFEISSL